MCSSQLKSFLKKYHAIIFGKQLFVIALIMLAIGMPVAPFLVGFSQFLIVFNWLVEGRFFEKIATFKKSRALHIFLLLFIVHLVWLLNTSDFKYALHDLKIKLPLFILPIIVATSHPLSRQQLKKILLFFAATVVTGTFISFAVYLGLLNHEVKDIRDISIFISHIRFGLMIVFSIVILLYYLRHNYTIISIGIKLVYLFSILWLLIFLIVLQSATSWIVLMLLTYFIIVFYYKELSSKTSKIFAWFYMLGMPLFVAGLIGVVLVNFYHLNKVDFDNLPTHTNNGGKYIHHATPGMTENGNYIWLYICYNEMRESWGKYSDLPFDGKDAKGQTLKMTLIRYLTSKNLTKDAEGLSKLDEQDVRMIEAGYASNVYRVKFPPYVKVYEIVWELNYYLRFGNPNAKTVSMRIEFIKAGTNIFKNNFLLGVGTGDVKNAFANYYEQSHSKLTDNYRLRAHNQYLTFMLTFGIIGFLIVVIAFVKPILLNQGCNFALVFSFLVIVLISMLNEDTLETQSGVTFFAFFYSIFILSKKND